MLSRLRAWAKTYVDQKRYSPITVGFHWIMAALVLFQLWWGWRMGRLWPGGDKLEAYQVHNALGLLLLVLVLGRGAWRGLAPNLLNAADRPGWQSKAANFTHGLLYVCLIGLPLSGWAMWSSMAPEQPLSAAGLLPWPQLPFEALERRQRWLIFSAAETTHLVLILLLLLLIPIHAGAALKHHFIDRDDVLAAMVPGLLPLAPRAETRQQQGREDAQHRPQQPPFPAAEDAS